MQVIPKSDRPKHFSAARSLTEDIQLSAEPSEHFSRLEFYTPEQLVEIERKTAVSLDYLEECVRERIRSKL